MNATSNGSCTHSNKKHLFLTGHPSVGKTTIIVNTIQHLHKAFLAAKKKHNKSGHKQKDDLHVNLNIHGFYTEECRDSKGDRIGFDIIHWSDIHDWNDNNDGNVDMRNRQVRVPLSRSVEKIKKSDPHVGKYLVNLENIEQYAIPAIIPSSSSSSSSSSSMSEDGRDKQSSPPQEQQQKFELIVLDEIGKMEMLCPQFLPAVMNTLDTTSTSSTNINNNNIHQIVFGTIPTPRYGRVIPAIENIRARDDIMPWSYM